MLSADRARTHGAFLVLLFALQLGLIVAETRISGTWTKLGDEGAESPMRTYRPDAFWPAAAGGAASFRIDGGMIICGGGNFWQIGRGSTIWSVGSASQCCLFNETIETWTWCDATHFTPSLAQPAAWYHMQSNSIWVWGGKQINSSFVSALDEIPPLQRMFRANLTIGSPVPISSWEEIPTSGAPASTMASSAWVSQSGIFYLGGGREEAGWTTNELGRNYIYKFDPNSRVWVNLMPQSPINYDQDGIEDPGFTPETLTESAIAIDGQYVWQFGGWNLDYPMGPDVSLWRFNTANDKWAKMNGNPLRRGNSYFKDRGFFDADHVPQPRRSGAMALAGGYLWIMGGLTACGGTSEMWVYNPSNRSWAIVGTGTGMWYCDPQKWPGVTFNPVVWTSANGSSIYLFGGSGQNNFTDALGALSSLWRFDISITEVQRSNPRAGLPILESPGIQRTIYKDCSAGNPLPGDAPLFCAIDTATIETVGFLGNVDVALASAKAGSPFYHSGYLWNFGTIPQNYVVQTTTDDTGQTALNSTLLFTEADVGNWYPIAPWSNKGSTPYRKEVTLQPGPNKIDFYFTNTGGGGCQYAMLLSADLSTSWPLDSSFVSVTPFSNMSPTAPPTTSPLASPVSFSTPISNPVYSPITSPVELAPGSGTQPEQAPGGGIQFSLYTGTEPSGTPISLSTLSTINITFSSSETPHPSIPAGSAWSGQLVGTLFPVAGSSKRATSAVKFFRVTYDDGLRMAFGGSSYDNWLVSSGPQYALVNLTLQDAGSSFNLKFFTSDGHAVLVLEWSDSASGPWTLVPSGAFLASSPARLSSGPTTATTVPQSNSNIGSAPTEDTAVNVAGIIAGVVVAVVVLVAVVVALVWWRQKQNNLRQGSSKRSKKRKEALASTSDGKEKATAAEAAEEAVKGYEDFTSQSEEDGEEEDSESESDSEGKTEQRSTYAPAPAPAPPSAPELSDEGENETAEEQRSLLVTDFKEEWMIDFDMIDIGRKIGSGAFGIVWTGTYNAEDVAIKQCNIVANQAAIAEFRREAVLLLSLKPHPSIVQVLGISVPKDSSAIYMIMEYCEGGSLDSLMAEKNLSDDAKIGMIDSIARGLVHLHRNNVVHRDLAARNILVAAGNKAKISDFGMSRIVDTFAQKNTTAATIGPIRWMAPESLSKREYSPASDVWTFAIVCWEVWTGRLPWDDVDDLIAVAIKIRSDGAHPEPPESMPQWLQGLLLQCWAVKPDERPTMVAIAAAIRQHTSASTR